MTKRDSSTASDLRRKVLAPHAAALALDGRYDEAEEWLRCLIGDDPQTDTFCLLGKVKAQRGDLAGAADAFEAALRLDPGAADAAAALARVHAMREHVPVAYLHFWKAATGLLLGLLLVVFLSGSRGKVSREVEASGPEPATDEALAALRYESSRMLAAHAATIEAQNGVLSEQSGVLNEQETAFASLRTTLDEQRAALVAQRTTMARLETHSTQVVESAARLQARLDAAASQALRQESGAGPQVLHGLLERRQVRGFTPRYFLMLESVGAVELTCSTRRYDLELFTGYRILVQGEPRALGPAQENLGGPGAFDVHRLTVLDGQPSDEK